MKLALCKFFLVLFIFGCSGQNKDKGEFVKSDNNGSSVSNKDFGKENVIVLGGGCFWCMEAVFQRMKGVGNVTSGYSGGHVPNPSYEDVCTGNTGHAEVIRIEFDTSEMSLADILKVFFIMHDPTTLNRQGNDVGTQYRSVIFYTTENQKKIAEQVIQELSKEKIYDKPVVTEVKPLINFYEAEKYHQNYFNKNPQQSYCRFVIQPKVEKFEKIFSKFSQQKK